MNTGTLILLNGASSAGKTSLLKALQRQFDVPYLDAGIDKFIFMLPGRYLERPLWDDLLGLADRAGLHGHQFFSGMHYAIAALLQRGNNVLADHVLVEPAWVDECATLFADRPAYLIGVHCPLALLETRERERKDRTLGQAAVQFSVVHAYAQYDYEVDTSLVDPETGAAQIKQFLASGVAPRAFKQLKAKRKA